MSSSLIPTPADIQYQEAHIHESRQHEVVASNVAVLTLATVAVVLRLIARRITKASVQKDDYTIIVALVLAYGYSAVLFQIVHLGGMKHVIAMKDPIAVGKLIIAAEECYNPAICAVKLSYLMLYYRLFPNRKLRIACWATGAVIICYTVIGSFCDIFVCRPISAAWNPTIADPTCLDINKEYVIFAIFNVITDFVLMAMPLPILWKLQLTKERKIQLMGIFLTGSFVTVVSIYRVPQMKLAREDASYKDVDAAIWSAVEICVGIVSACLPTLRPIVTSLSGSVKDRKLWTKSSFTNSRTISRDFQNLQAGDLEMPGMVHYHHQRSASTLGSKPMSPVSPMSPATPVRNDRFENYPWQHDP